MSALGQKPTFAVQNGMSALPSKADIDRRFGNVRFVPMADIAVSLDHFVSCQENAIRYGDAKRLGSFEIDY